jgi:hypothetical protein
MNFHMLCSIEKSTIDNIGIFDHSDFWIRLLRKSIQGYFANFHDV